MQKERQEGYRQARKPPSTLRWSHLAAALALSKWKPSASLPSPSTPPGETVQKCETFPKDFRLRKERTADSKKGFMTPRRRCDSPAPMYPCDGWCEGRQTRLQSSAEAGVFVLAFGACKDDQESWEDADGSSMSTALVDILSAKPNVKLSDLMSRLSVKMHSSAVSRHRKGKDYKRSLKSYVRMTGRKMRRRWEGDIDNFQEPQVRFSNWYMCGKGAEGCGSCRVFGQWI